MTGGRRAKDALKRLVKETARFAGRLPVFPARPSRILTYHSVGNRSHEMNVRPEMFAEQMAWLSEKVSLIGLEEAAQGQPGVAVTFDDGFRDNLLYAAPVLRETRIPATIFMIAGRAGKPMMAGGGASERLLDWDELRELKAQGIQIGAHTLTHPRLSQLGEDAQRAEIQGAKELLESQLECAIDAFAYPYGSALDYTATTTRLVQEAGFRIAVSNRYGPNPPGADPFTLRRIWIDATDDLTLFTAKVLGRLDVLVLQDSPAGIRLRRGLNRWL